MTAMHNPSQESGKLASLLSRNKNMHSDAAKPHLTDNVPKLKMKKSSSLEAAAALAQGLPLLRTDRAPQKKKKSQ
jgi:hypothetical protein